MKDPLVQDVSDTAFWIASHRARETARPDALFKDPLAAKLAGERGDRIAREMPSGHITGWSVTLRTLVIDEFILRAVSKHGVDTIVNLGAGLDTRPYRLAVPESLRWIEVDFPGVIDFKKAELQGERPRCRLERIGQDLTDRAARRKLLAELGSKAKRVLVLTEGVVPYLTEDEAGSLAEDLAGVSTFHYWIVDYFSPQVMRFRHKLSRNMKNAAFQFRPADWFSFFESRGWKVGEMRYLVPEGMRIGRPAPFPWYGRALIRLGWFLTPKSKRDRFNRALGYALLERK